MTSGPRLWEDFVNGVLVDILLEAARQYCGAGRDPVVAGCSCSSSYFHYHFANISTKETCYQGHYRISGYNICEQ